MPWRAADAGSRQSVTARTTWQSIQQREDQTSAGSAERMTESNRAALSFSTPMYSPIGVRLPPRMKTSLPLIILNSAHRLEKQNQRNKGVSAPAKLGTV